MVKAYATPTDFRKALEARLYRTSEGNSIVLQRLRKQVAFDRLLARLCIGEDAVCVLKGGYALELRFANARSTKDVDLDFQDKLLPAVADHKPFVVRAVIEAVAVNLNDYFVFIVGERHGVLDGPRLGGVRIPIEARVDNRVFARFHIDIGIGDKVLTPIDELEGEDWLGFACIPRPRFLALSKEQQFAEKLHAYVAPRMGPRNSRVKDLIDMYLLITKGSMDGKTVARAIELVFDKRGEPIPRTIARPPEEWETPFMAMADECGINSTMEEAFAALRDYLEVNASLMLAK